ncbi:MAG: YkvA family protein [Alphaproteobacteria bacterium]
MSNSSGWRAAADFDFSPAALPVVLAANQKRVGRGFWRKLARVGARIPFAHDAVAAYFCAADPKTPGRVRAILLAALAYFVLPFDAIPDVFVGLGFTDDATVLAAAMALVASHISPQHRRAATNALDQVQRGDG